MAVYAVVWVGLLILIKKDSPLNVLTRSWASFILFFAIETAALLIVLFGGLLTAVSRPCRERPEVVRPLAYTIPLACFARG